MDKGIKEYIGNQVPAQKKILTELDRIITETFPGIASRMRYGTPWYGDMYYTVALSGHVNLGFCIGGLTKEQVKLLEGSGKTMRHIKIQNGEEADIEKVIKLLKMVDDSGCKMP